MIRRNTTAVIDRNVFFEGPFASEPYECGWATEAIFYVRKLEADGAVAGTTARVQISPDGMRWCDEGTEIELTNSEVDFIKVSHFGNWLRIAGELPAGARAKVVVALHLKE